MMITRTPTRRTVLLGAASAAAGLALSGRASAQAKGTCVVATWGGDFHRLMDATVGQPLQAKNGVSVKWDIGRHDARKAKMITERRLPSGTIDVASLQDTDMFDMSSARVLKDLDAGAIPNLNRLLPAFRTGYSAPHLYSGMVIIYNPAHLKPAKLSDLWDPKLSGKVGLVGPLHVRMIAMATLASGNPLSSYEPGKKQLMDLKKLKPRIYSTNEAVAQALQTGEIWAVPLWRARAVQWQKAGLPIANVAPEEGIMPITYEVGIPRNAANPEAASAFANLLLSPEAQLGFAEGMGYSPVVDNANLPAELQAQIGFSKDEQLRIKTLDQQYLSRDYDQLKDWWDREFLA